MSKRQFSSWAEWIDYLKSVRDNPILPEKKRSKHSVTVRISDETLSRVETMAAEFKMTRTGFAEKVFELAIEDAWEVFNRPVSSQAPADLTKDKARLDWLSDCYLQEHDGYITRDWIDKEIIDAAEWAAKNKEGSK